MPVYNGGRYLDETIESVISQDVTDFEFVIVDDGSTDATPQILQRWAARDPRMVVIHLPANGGIPRALNRGLAVARGKYVTRQDCDDLCMRGRLRRQVDVLEQEADVVLVSSNHDLIDADGNFLATVVCQNPPEVTAYLLTFGNAVSGGGSQAMFRRNLVSDVGGFREDYAFANDYEFWARLSRRGRIVTLPIVGTRVRLHDRRVTILYSERQRRYSMATSRWMITELLGRPITEKEEDAVASVWRAEGRPVVAGCADVVFREAYAQFSKANASRAHHRRVRFETASHWFRSAVALARNGKFAYAAIHLAYSVRWHPCALPAGAIFMVGRIFMHSRNAALRRLRPRSLPGSRSTH